MGKQTSELADAAIGTICGVRGEQRWNSPFALDPHGLAGHLDQQFEGRQRARCRKTGGESSFPTAATSTVSALAMVETTETISEIGKQDTPDIADPHQMLPRTRATSLAPRQNRPQTSGCTSERTERGHFLERCVQLASGP